MANVLPKDKQIAVISALGKGTSMCAILRMAGHSRRHDLPFRRACGPRLREVAGR